MQQCCIVADFAFPPEEDFPQSCAMNGIACTPVFGFCKKVGEIKPKVPMSAMDHQQNLSANSK